MTEVERERHFERIFKDNYKKLYLYAVYLIGDSEQAKDLVSDVFGWVWENYASVEVDGIESYLFISIRNRCFDYMHHIQVVNQYAEMYMQYGDVEESTWEDYDERIDRILELIESMPPQTKFIMEQCYLYEKTYKEVGRILNMSPNGVGKHIIKGLQIIRKDFSVNYKKGQRLNPDAETY